MKQRYLALALSTLFAGAAPMYLHADTASLADFSGAWRLDDANSDNDAAVTKLLQDESGREQAANDQQPAQTTAPSPTERAGLHGRRGGGGHAKHDKDDKKADDEPAKPHAYPLPPLLKTDTVLLIQQDNKNVQIRLNSGETMTARLDGQSQQSLNGNAIVRGHNEAGKLVMDIQFADGSTLQQRWELSADKHHITISEQWKPFGLQQPVNYKRSYVELGS